MREPTWRQKHLILSFLTLGCLAVDAAILIALCHALKWLFEASPFALAALIASVIVAVRVFWRTYVVLES